MSPLPAGTLVDGRLKELPLSRRLVLLVIFCLAQFLDSFNDSALFSALPALEVSMGMTESQYTWMISAFQLTFASFLLIVSAYPRISSYTLHQFRVAVSAMYTTRVSVVPLLDCDTEEAHRKRVHRRSRWPWCHLPVHWIYQYKNSNNHL